MNNISLISINEIDNVMEIINDAKELLKHHSLQWQQGYPNKEVMINDINNNFLYGYYFNNNLVGIVALIKGINPYYLNIYDGKWSLKPSEYDLVIHRIAVKKEYHHKNIGDSLIKYAIEYAKRNNCNSIKVDTHIKNEIMQNLLKQNNYILISDIVYSELLLGNVCFLYNRDAGIIELLEVQV